MPHKDPVNWQPISEMPLIAGMIDGALEDTREHMKTLAEAQTRPHVLDDATIDRVERVHAEQLEFVDIYAQQISRWRTENLSKDPDARAGPDGDAERAPAGRDRRCPRVGSRVAQEYHRARLGHERRRTRPADRSWAPTAQPSLTRPMTLRAIPLPYVFAEMGLPPHHGGGSSSSSDEALVMSVERRG